MMDVMTPRRKMPKANFTIGALQRRVLDVLWKEGPRSLSEVHQTLLADDQIAYTTVSTELNRLIEKGLVSKTGLHLTTRYAAVFERKAFVEQAVSATIGDLLSTHGHAAVHGFVDAIAHDDTAVAEVLRLLEERRSSR
jgi:predicted transcriptional regulator